METSLAAVRFGRCRIGYVVAMGDTRDRDDWSTPISDDEAADQPDTPVDDGGRVSAAEAIAPGRGLSNPAGDLTDLAADATGAAGGRHEPTSAQDQEPSELAPRGYDDRQQDATPVAPRETPREYADRERD
jgi:hypothetical protein